MASKVYNLAKKMVQSALHSMGVDLIRYNAYTSTDVLLQTIIKHFGIKTILDIGANEGLYALLNIEKGFKGRIFSFEPVESVYKQLEARAANHPNWKTFHLAVGSGEGESTINVSENFVSSSLFKVGQNSLKAQPQTRVMRTEVIKVRTIDSILPELDAEAPILLKLDVQGYELEALKGSVRSLPLIGLIQAELSFVPVYEGAPLFREVVDFLDSHGFELYAIIPGFTDGKTGRILQADGVFSRKQPG